ncbi:MAG: T9SS type A sorting domain-containing protein [Bacteroidota bacterium]
MGGNVSGNGKSIAVSGAEVILMDATNNPLAYKLTDASGNYSFTNLALGTYKVVVEILGKNCTIATITISTGNQNANSTNFIVTGANITASVEESIWFTNHISDVYPNPSNGNASIDFSLLKSNKISIKIYNNLGQLLLTNDNEYSIGSHKVKLNTNQLSVGIYTIEISAENSTRIIKKFVKTK